MENNVKVLKLITGEEVFARVTEEENNLITFEKPMTLQSVPNKKTGQMGVALIPWIMSGKSEKITISTDHIIAQDKPKEQVEKNYLSTITGLTL